MLLLFCFLLGCLTGLRSLTPAAVVCWAAHEGWLNVAGSKLAFIGRWPTVVLFTLLALAELVADKLPNTPARTQAVGLSARILMGAFCALAVAINAQANMLFALAFGIAGAIVGTFAGYNLRHAIVSRAHIPDFLVALVEDLMAIVGGVLIASRVAGV